MLYRCVHPYLSANLRTPISHNTNSIHDRHTLAKPSTGCNSHHNHWVATISTYNSRQSTVKSSSIIKLTHPGIFPAGRKGKEGHICKLVAGTLFQEERRYNNGKKLNFPFFSLTSESHVCTRNLLKILFPFVKYYLPILQRPYMYHVLLRSILTPGSQIKCPNESHLSGPTLNRSQIFPVYLMYNRRQNTKHVCIYVYMYILPFPLLLDFFSSVFVINVWTTRSRQRKHIQRWRLCRTVQRSIQQ